MNTKPRSIHRFPSLALIFLGVVLPVSVRSDSTNWHWQFDQPLFVVGPSDSVTITATVFNDPSASDNLRITEVGGSFTGDLQHVYHFALGNTENPSEYAYQLLWHTLAPGEGLSYVIGRLTPMEGYVQPGVYDAYEAALYLNGILRPAQNSFQIVVVPEPASLGIFGLATIGVFLRFRRRTRRAAWRMCSE